MRDDKPPVIRKSREECQDDIEKGLWDMHENIPSKAWSCGKFVAERISPKTFSAIPE